MSDAQDGMELDSEDILLLQHYNKKRNTSEDQLCCLLAPPPRESSECTLNIRGVRGHEAEVNDFFDRHALDVICLQEVMLIKSSSYNYKRIKLQNCPSVRRKDSAPLPRGGVPGGPAGEARGRSALRVTIHTGERAGANSLHSQLLL